MGWLNGINILGAAIGCLVGAWVLVPMTGFEGALRVGACVSAVAGLVALGLSFRLDAAHSVIPDTAMSGQVAPANTRMLVWPLVFFLSGFLAIALQVVWFRISILVSDNSPLVFSLILAVFLFFDGLGSLLGTRWNWHSPWRTFLLLQLLIVAWAVFSVWWLPHWFYDTHTRWSAFFPLLMVAPAALLIGAAFPVVQRAVQDDLGRVGERVGILQVANLAGNVLAGLLTGLVLLEFWGSSSVFRLAILLAAAGAGGSGGYLAQRFAGQAGAATMDASRQAGAGRYQQRLVAERRVRRCGVISG